MTLGTYMLLGLAPQMRYMRHLARHGFERQVAFPLVNIGIYGFEIAIQSIICYFPQRQITHYHYYTQIAVFMVTVMGFLSAYDYHFMRHVDEYPELSQYRSLMLEMGWVRAVLFVCLFFFMLYCILHLVQLGNNITRSARDRYHEISGRVQGV